MNLQTILRFIKYCAVGVLNTGVSYVVFALLHYLGCNPEVSLAISYVAGMGTSYALNARWTFQRSTWSAREAVVFLLTNGVILLLSEGSLEILRRHIGNVYAAQAVNLIPITLLGFIANQLIVFPNRTKRAELDAAPVKGGNGQ